MLANSSSSNGEPEVLGKLRLVLAASSASSRTVSPSPSAATKRAVVLDVDKPAESARKVARTATSTSSSSRSPPSVPTIVRTSSGNGKAGAMDAWLACLAKRGKLRQHHVALQEQTLEAERAASRAAHELNDATARHKTAQADVQKRTTEWTEAEARFHAALKSPAVLYDMTERRTIDSADQAAREYHRTACEARQHERAAYAALQAALSERNSAGTLFESARKAHEELEGNLSRCRAQLGGKSLWGVGPVLIPVWQRLSRCSMKPRRTLPTRTKAPARSLVTCAATSSTPS